MDEASITTAQEVVPTEYNIDKFLNIVAHAFDRTPHTIAFSSELLSQSIQPQSMFDARKAHLSSSVSSSALSESVIVEAGNWSAVALWKLPTHSSGSTSPALIDGRPLLNEWKTSVHGVKFRHLSRWSRIPSTDKGGLLPHYELVLLARNPSGPPTKGAISAVVRPFLVRAVEENIPVWLEATHGPAVSIYEHFGFRVVEEVTIGQKQVNRSGRQTNNGSGEGIKAWGMIYDRHIN